MTVVLLVVMVLVTVVCVAAGGGCDAVCEGTDSAVAFKKKNKLCWHITTPFIGP